jgi:hypothetical protein
MVARPLRSTAIALTAVLAAMLVQLLPKVQLATAPPNSVE